MPPQKRVGRDPRRHLRKIVALAEIYGADAVDRAIQDGIAFAAYSCEYIANILEMRTRQLPEPGALHLSCRQDLLDIEIAIADLSLYKVNDRGRKTNTQPSTDPLRAHLGYLKLPYLLEHYESLAQTAAAKHWSHVEYVARLIEGEAQQREDRSIQRRIGLARFPLLKTPDQFGWGWPKKINRPQIQNLFRLQFIEDHANVIFMANVGLGKSHFTIATPAASMPIEAIFSDCSS